MLMIKKTVWSNPEKLRRKIFRFHPLVGGSTSSATTRKDKTIKGFINENNHGSQIYVFGHKLINNCLRLWLIGPYFIPWKPPKRSFNFNELFIWCLFYYGFGFSSSFFGVKKSWWEKLSREKLNIKMTRVVLLHWILTAEGSTNPEMGKSVETFLFELSCKFC